MDVADSSCPSAWSLGTGHRESGSRGGMAGAAGGQLRPARGRGLGREWERMLLRGARQALLSPPMGQGRLPVPGAALLSSGAAGILPVQRGCGLTAGAAADWAHPAPVRGPG